MLLPRLLSLWQIKRQLYSRSRCWLLRRRRGGVRPSHGQSGGGEDIRLSAQRGERADDVSGQPLTSLRPHRHRVLQVRRPLQPPPPPHVRGHQVRRGLPGGGHHGWLHYGPRNLPPGASLLGDGVCGLPGLLSDLHLPEVQVQGDGQAEVFVQEGAAGGPKFWCKGNNPGAGGADQRQRGRPASPGAENHRQAGPDDGQGWSRSVWRGLGRQVEGREGGGEGFLHLRGGLLVP